MSETIVLQVGVKVLLKNPQGKYLLLRRNPKKYPEVGPKWDIVGGRINPGSGLMENLKREVFEETKLNLTSLPKLAAAQDILKVPGRHVVRLRMSAKSRVSRRLTKTIMRPSGFLPMRSGKCRQPSSTVFLRNW